MRRKLLPASADPSHAIVVRDLRVRLDGFTVLDGVTAAFRRRGINALIGPNGAGKTTLVKALLGLLPFEGRIEFRAENGRAPRLGYVPQRLDFDRGAPVTVLDLLCADQRRPLWLGRSLRARERAAAALARVGADRLLHATLGRLSGGELQRVLVALALLGEPHVLLLDEPVAGVDVAGEAMFCDLLVRLRDEAGLTIVLVSHEMSIVVQHTDHVVCLNERRVQCEGDALTALSAENVARVFGYHAAIYEHGAGARHDCTQHGGGHRHPHMPAAGGGEAAAQEERP